jgi:hypothetical protein
MEELKRCPFCGGEVAIDEASGYLTSWMLITRGNGKNECKCRVFMESKLYNSDCSEADKEKIKKTLSKHGTNATKRTEHGQKTRQLYIPTILL